MKPVHSLLVIALLLAVAAPVAAQMGGRDPLNPKEADALREAAQDPAKRLKLMVQFARVRLVSIEQLRGDPKLAAGRGLQVHDLLEDFTTIMDELGDNIDDYADRRYDVRKPLKEVIEAGNEFQLKLHTIEQQGAGAGAQPGEVDQYRFALRNALDSVNSDLDDSRSLLAEQEAEVKRAKEKKKQ